MIKSKSSKDGKTIEDIAYQSFSSGGTDLGLESNDFANRVHFASLMRRKLPQ